MFFRRRQSPAEVDDGPRPRDKLRQEIIGLGPWHHDIPVTPELSTGIWKETPSSELPEHFRDMSLFAPGVTVRDIVASVYGDDGLRGKTVLDWRVQCGRIRFCRA